MRWITGDGLSIEVRALPGRWPALGVAAHFVARREPFARFPAGELLRTLSGQVERGHALFAFAGATVVGYLGWAMYDSAAADRFARTGVPPTADPVDGEVVWVLTAAAERDAALAALIRGLRRRYPGRRAMGMRHRAGGARVVFDQPIRPRAGEGAP